MRINLGTDKKPARLDLAKLLESRLLIQASSGAGKSWLLRVLAEQVLPHMPVILLDWEGEFASLRQKFDTVLVGPGGEVPAEIKAAKLLSRRLIELQVSAVVDLSDLKMHQRQEYVQVFVDALISLPKKQWPASKGKAVLVIVDEAHKLCPEKTSSVSASSIIDLQSLGRKRGLCGVLATQRLSKLDKDAAAECNNVVVGRTSAVDHKKACDVLGLPLSDRHELTTLQPGHWRAVGPAFEPGIHTFVGGTPQTEHAKFGKKLLTPPAPSTAIQRVLPELEDLSQEAAKEIKDLQDAKKEISNLRRELTQAKKGRNTEVKTQTVKEIVVDDRAVSQAVRQRDKQWQSKLQEANKIIRQYRRTLQKVADAVGVSADNGQAKLEPPEPAEAALPSPQPAKMKSIDTAVTREVNSDHEGLTKPQQRVLDALAWWENVGEAPPDKPCVAVIAGYKVSGNFTNLLGGLRSTGLIDYPGGGTVQMTDAGRALAEYPASVGTLEDLHRAWYDKLTGPQQRVLEVIIANHPQELDKQQVADLAGYRVSGNFTNILGSLRGLGVITKRGPIAATDLLFPGGLC